jgi:phage protein U
MAGYTLYVWGGLVFETYPFNVHEMEHVTETDWARKEIVDAAVHHEWVGENEEELHFRGRVFPRYFARMAALRSRGTGSWRSGLHSADEVDNGNSGLSHLDIMDNRRRLGEVHALALGDGWHHGWFGIKRLQRGHTFMDEHGIGQQINFEVLFTRFPIPNDPAPYFPQFWGSAA